MQTGTTTRERACRSAKPIASFQAIQQQLAVLAGHAAAASMASRRLRWRRSSTPTAETLRWRWPRSAGGAVGHAGDHDRPPGPVAPSASRARRSLHLATRRLWSWRAEFGAEAVWAGGARPQSLARRGRRRLLAGAYPLDGMRPRRPAPRARNATASAPRRSSARSAGRTAMKR
jgi:hypothetical protein